MNIHAPALQLKDMRDKVYLSPSVSVFRGGGHRLGGQRCPSRLLPSPQHMGHRSRHDDHSHGDHFLEKQRRATDTTSELPGKGVC